MGKIEFSSVPRADFYAYLNVSVLERTSGIVDRITFALSDVIGIKQVNGTGTIPGLISQGERLPGISILRKPIVMNWRRQLIGILRCSNV